MVEKEQKVKRQSELEAAPAALPSERCAVDAVGGSLAAADDEQSKVSLKECNFHCSSPLKTDDAGFVVADDDVDLS